MSDTPAGTLGPVVTLEPDPAVAGPWGLGALVATLLAGWLVAVPGLVVLGGVMLLVGAALTWLLLRQAVAPRACTLVVDDRGVRGWHLGTRVDVPMTEVASASVRRFLGEPALALTGHDGTVRTVLLPTGADTAELEQVLTGLGPGSTR